MLSAEDQERFSRHLLLDGLGGAGQERLCAGAVSIDLPGPFSAVAASCARALAAAGVGTLILRGPWAGSSASECERLAPGARIVLIRHEAPEQPAAAIDRAAQVKVYVPHEAKVYVGHEASEPLDAPGSSHELALPGEAPAAPSEAAALGALAALEALKRLAGAGRRAVLPLAVFPAVRDAAGAPLPHEPAS